MSKRRKCTPKIPENSSSVLEGSDGKLVHLCVNGEDVIQHKPASNALLGRVDLPVGYAAQHNSKARGHNFNESIRQRKRTQIAGIVDTNVVRTGSEFLFGQEQSVILELEFINPR